MYRCTGEPGCHHITRDTADVVSTTGRDYTQCIASTAEVDTLFFITYAQGPVV